MLYGEYAGRLDDVRQNNRAVRFDKKERRG
jgi:hypothetical protein